MEALVEPNEPQAATKDPEMGKVMVDVELISNDDELLLD